MPRLKLVGDYANRSEAVAAIRGIPELIILGRSIPRVHAVFAADDPNADTLGRYNVARISMAGDVYLCNVEIRGVRHYHDIIRERLGTAKTTQA